LAEFEDKFRAYYARLLFFAFLTKSRVCSVEDIIACMDKADNARISKNLEITKPALKAIQKYFNKFILSEWDYKIDNLNALSRDDSLKPLERAQTAIRKFDRLGVSEIMTPEKIADDMVALFPEDELKRIAQSGEKILDIASKAGEFAIALYKRYKKIDSNIDVSDLILSIPTSSHTYEFTRNVYEALGLNLDNIAEKFTSYDLLEVKKSNGEIDYDRIKFLLSQKKAFRKITMNDKVSTRGKHFTIAGAVGNPPYQKDDGGNGRSASAIYPEFLGIGSTTATGCVSMIMPAKWYSGGKGLDHFRGEMLNSGHISRLVDYMDSHQCFGDVADVAGGVCYFLHSKGHNGACRCVNYDSHGNIIEAMRNLGERDVFVRHPIANGIIRKIEAKGERNMDEMVSPRKPFGLATNVIPIPDGDLSLRTNSGWAKYKRDKLAVGVDLVDKWNVMMSYLSAEHAGQPDKNGMFKILSSLDILPPGSICTETYILAGSFTKKDEAENLLNYLKSRFVRFLVGQVAMTQHITRSCFCFVPRQDFTESWTDEKLYEKYGITESEQKFIESLIKPME